MLKIESFEGEETGASPWGGGGGAGFPEQDDELDRANADRIAGGLSGLDEDTEDDDEELEDPDIEMRRREAEMIYGSANDVSGPVGGATGGAGGLGGDAGWEDFFAEAETWTITRLAPGVRDQNRVNVFLDGHFAFSLDVAQVVDLDVKVNQKVSKERLKELQCASEFGKLYQRTLEWVLTRPHSVRETRDYLKRRKFKRQMLNRQRAREEKRPLPEIQDDIATQVVMRLVEKGYLDDLKFAKFYVENRHVRKGISHKRLRMELKRKGVDDEKIHIAMNTVSRDENEEIMKMIAKKCKKYNDFQLVGYLSRQGFDLQTAKTAVERYKLEDE